MYKNVDALQAVTMLVYEHHTLNDLGRSAAAQACCLHTHKLHGGVSIDVMQTESNHSLFWLETAQHRLSWMH